MPIHLRLIHMNQLFLETIQPLTRLEGNFLFQAITTMLIELYDRFYQIIGYPYNGLGQLTKKIRMGWPDSTLAPFESFPHAIDPYEATGRRPIASSIS